MILTLAFGLAGFCQGSESVFGLMIGFCVYLLIRLPVGTAIVASACEAIYNIDSSTFESIFDGCSSYNKDVAFVGLLIDWIFLGFIVLIGLSILTIGFLFC